MERLRLSGDRRAIAALNKRARALVRDRDGAALIEYAVLIGLLVVAVLTVITAVGGWVNTQWTTLNPLINP